MRYIHIFAGLLALISSAVALYVVKGGKIHRKSGMIFVYTMLVMSATGAIMATFKLKNDSLVAGILTFYLVATALFTVSKTIKGKHWLNICAILIGLNSAFWGIYFGIEGLNTANGKTDSDSIACIIFGTVGLLSVVGDLRMIFAKEFNNKQRIIRHLWRMCFAMFLAVTSFFLGQMQVFPEPIRKFPLLVIPVLSVLLIMIYWLLKVRFGRKFL